MRGAYLLGAGIGAGLAGNVWCWRTGRPTTCFDVRRLPKPLVTTSLLGGVVLFHRHLYPQETR
jgi:hypothetical protein